MLRRKRDKPEPVPAPAGNDEFRLDSRMDAILNEVRQEADRILEDARRRAAAAGGDLDERLAGRRERLLELADELSARAEAVLDGLEGAAQTRTSLDRMVRALGEAADEISFELAATPLGPRAAEGQPDAEPQPEASPEGRDAAIQMAAAGATRSQVGARLREFPDVGDPDSLLDEVFGPMAAADARVPWAVRRDDA